MTNVTQTANMTFMENSWLTTNTSVNTWMSMLMRPCWNNIWRASTSW